jgi:hypothetical protein
MLVSASQRAAHRAKQDSQMRRPLRRPHAANTPDFLFVHGQLDSPKDAVFFGADRCSFHSPRGNWSMRISHYSRHPRVGEMSPSALEQKK